MPVLLACAALAACGGSTDGPPAAAEPADRRGSAISIQDPCGAADYESQRLIHEIKDDEALVYLEKAIDACRERPGVRHRALQSVADIARNAQEHCPLAWELHGRVPRDDDVEYLRASIYLDQVCPRDEGHAADLARLVEIETIAIYGEADAALMEPYVAQCEAARWARTEGNKAELVERLTEATRTLCDDDEILNRAASIVDPGNDGACTAAFLFGYWLMHPTESPDEELKPCLRRVLAAVEPSVERYPASMRDGIRESLESLRQRLE